jgi:hypothetical protein
MHIFQPLATVKGSDGQILEITDIRSNELKNELMILLKSSLWN